MTMAVSVIICTWNRAALLSETLVSLAEQRVADVSEVEVIVVDNNSSDCTRQVVEAAAQGWRLGVLRYFFEGRQGKQFALNLGVAKARFPVIAFTDDDILFPADWVQHVQTVFVDPGVMLAGGKTQIAWGPQGRPHWYGDDMQAILGGVDLGNQRLDPAPAGYAPGGGNLIARKALFDRIGAFSETHFRHMDFEFGARAQTRGERVVYDPRLVVHAPVDEQCLTVRYFRRWSFKAGIDAAARGFPRVPAWTYRQVIEDWWATRRNKPGTLSPQEFSRELRMWRGWGTIANAWHAWLGPSRHAKWVMQRAQKKANVY